MKCSICGTNLDNAGDRTYYCPKCKKMYNESEVVRETKYESEKTNNYSYEAENREMPDVFDNSRNQYYEDTGRTVYEDKPEMIDETKPQKYVSVNKRVSVHTGSTSSVPKSMSTTAIIMLVLSFFFELLMPIAMIVSFVNAKKLKKAQPESEDAEEYKKSYRVCITCGIIELIFLIATVVVCAAFICIYFSAK